jgi:lysophospholipase L1-like esterase
VCCDKCSRWDIFDNCKSELGLDEYDEDKVGKMKFVCRMCVSDCRVEKLEGVVKQVKETAEAVTNKVRELEEMVKKEFENLRQDSDRVKGEISEQKEQTEVKDKRADESEKKLESRIMEVSVETRLQVSQLENKVGDVSSKIVIDEMKLDEEVKRLENRINEALSSAAAVELRVREMAVNWPTPQESSTGNGSSSSVPAPSRMEAESSNSMQKADGVRKEVNTRKTVGFAEKFKNKPKDTVLVVGSSMVRGVGGCLERDSDMYTKVDYSGARIENIQERLGEIGEKPQSHLVLMVGTNNLSGEGTSQIMNRYKELISAAKSYRYRKISVVGILRRSDRGSYINSKRVGINLRLEELCRENDVGYIEGGTGVEHLSGDGLHLNDEGQDKVAGAIFRHCNLYLN